MKVSHKERFRSKQRNMGSSKLVLGLVLICVIVLAATKICTADLGGDEKATALEFRQLQATKICTADLDGDEKATALGFRQLQEMPKSQCCRNPPALNSSYGAGHVEEIGGLNCYVSGSANSKCAVILVSDVYGYEAPHLRMVADRVTAAAGYYTLVPDFFHGDPFVDSENLTLWQSEHTELQGFKDAKPLIKALKNKGVVKIGAAGFCWGGKVAVELAKSRKYIKVAVLLHPSDVIVDDMKEVKVPLAVLGAELDSNLPPAMMREFKVALDASKEVDDSFVKIYPGVEHGWTLRYNDTDAVAVKKANEAHQDMLNWFLKHL